MPSRNIVKRYDVNVYYHVYNRGVEKRTIFIDDEDYAVFLNLLKRYLSPKPTKDSKGREYAWLAEEVKVAAFCLMPNHYHILLYQSSTDAMTRLMRSVCTAYASYFNTKYQRVGKLFQGHFKASLIDNDTYLTYISRYIHRNPDDYLHWEWSSLPYWIDKKHADWVHPGQIKSMTTEQYRRFIGDSDDFNESLEQLGSQLADI